MIQLAVIIHFFKDRVIHHQPTLFPWQFYDLAALALFPDLASDVDGQKSSILQFVQDALLFIPVPVQVLLDCLDGTVEPAFPFPSFGLADVPVVQEGEQDCLIFSQPVHHQAERNLEKMPIEPPARRCVLFLDGVFVDPHPVYELLVRLAVLSHATLCCDMVCQNGHNSILTHQRMFDPTHGGAGVAWRHPP